MSRSIKGVLAIAAAGFALAACSDINGSADNTVALAAAFQTVPVGFSASSNSFDANGDAGLPFYPGAISQPVGFNDKANGGGEHGDHHDGFGEGGLRGLLMGGGLGPDFIGTIGFGRGKGRGPFGIFNLPDSCTYDTGTGR